MAQIAAWPLGKLAVKTFTEEATKSGRGRAIPSLSKLFIATPPRTAASTSNAAASLCERSKYPTTANNTMARTAKLPSAVMSRAIPLYPRRSNWIGGTSDAPEREDHITIERQGRALHNLICNKAKDEEQPGDRENRFEQPSFGLPPFPDPLRDVLHVERALMGTHFIIYKRALRLSGHHL